MSDKIVSMRKTMSNSTYTKTKSSKSFRSRSLSPVKRSTSYTNYSKGQIKSRVKSRVQKIQLWWQKYKQIQQFKQKLKKHRRVRASKNISWDIKSTMNIFNKQMISKEQKKIKTQIEQNDISFLCRYCERKNGKIKDLLTKDQINASKNIINQIQENRKDKKLNVNPKLWQFHNCLNLQKIQLYSTNLKLSCQAWVVLDQLQIKYLRGYNPKIVNDFTPVLRILLAKIVDQLSQTINIDQVTIRVNDKQVANQKSKGLHPHTILSIRKLLTGLLMTSYQDMLIYSIYNIGYILHKLQNKSWNQQMTIVYLQQPSPNELNIYCCKIQQKCRNICQRLFLQNTYPMIKRDQFRLRSSALDICILFMKCIHCELIQKAFNYRIYQPSIRYQVGWKYWQTRHVKWVNHYYNKHGIQGVGGKNDKNQCYVVFDPQMKILIGIADSKINMHLNDIKRIQEWVRTRINRFNKYYNIKAKYSPLVTKKIFQIN